MRLFTALACLLSLAAFAGPLEDRRAEDTRAHATLSTLLDRQAALRTELNQRSQEVAQLKAREQGHVTASAELKDALQKTQATSDSLDALAREVDAAQADAKSKDAALAQAIGEAMGQLRAAWGKADAAQRPALVEQLRTLSAERDRLRGASGTGPMLVQAQGDDPADLLAQADALRDSEDKVRRQLAEVQSRLADAKNARELERRMGELGADNSLFDEQDRRLRLTKTSSGAVAIDRPSGGAASDTTTTPTASGPGTFGNPPPGGMTGGPSVGGAPEVHASDHQAPLGLAQVSIPAGDDVAGLEKAQAQLQSLASELEARAKAAEAKANDAR